MSTLEKSILATIIYYDILDYPLTCLEILKYLHQPPQSRTLNRPSLWAIQETLENSLFLQRVINQKNGFYFIKGRQKIFKNRITRQKIAQNKWKKVRKIIQLLQIVPYLRMIGVTGSLAINHPKKGSDLDLFIITAPDRIWTTRIIVTALTQIIGQRRYGSKIANRICLNSYLTENSLKIAPENLYSAHEYSCLVPILDNDCYIQFQQANTWIQHYLYPAPFNLGNNQKSISPNKGLRKFAQLLEKILDRPLGEWLEKKLAQYQKKRIQIKIQDENPDSQIAFNDNCLMFHPAPKSLWIKREYNFRIEQVLSI